MAFGALAYDPMTGLPIGAEEAPPDAPVAPSFGPGMGGGIGEALRRLTGTQFGQPRLQLWPEKMVRSAVTLPGDVAAGHEVLLPPGLRREDYTDIPRPQGPTEDSTALGRAMGWAPGSWQPNDPVYERAQDTAGMAGGGMMFGRMAAAPEAAAVRAPAVARPVARAAAVLEDSSATGAPLAALERVSPETASPLTYWSDLAKTKHAIPVEEMSAIRQPQGEMLPRKIISPEDLEGSILTPAVGDRTKAGARLTQVNDTKLSRPVDLEGGPEFMRGPSSVADNAVWASDKGVIKRIANHTRALAEDSGKDVNFVYSSMGARSGDFSHMMSDALVGQLYAAPITKRARAEFDTSMRAQNPDWPGLNSPNLREVLLSSGPMRKQFVEEAALKSHQDKGFPDIGSTRAAITEGALLGEPTGASGYSISRLDPSGRIIEDPKVPHQTYNTQLAGTYLGGLAESLPREVLFPDFFKERRAKGLPKLADDRAFSMSNVSQLASPEWLDTVMKVVEANKGAPRQKIISLLEDASATGAPVAALEHQSPAGQYHALLDQPPAQAYKSPDVAEATAHPSQAAPARGDVTGGAGGGDAGLHQAAAEAARRAGAHQPLEGLPTKAMKIGDEYFVPGPIASVRDVAADYMANKPVPSYHKQPTKYHPLDEDHSRAIAKAFDEMKHDPDNPAVQASYKAMIDETKAQYQAIEKTGLKIEPIEPGMPDPYAKNPRLAAKDVADNNHLWYFPTDAGFGSNPAAGIDMAKHPMMQPTGIKLGDRELLANDLFRIVHDYFGHLKEGYGFRAAGEDNAWRSHASMYSDLARPAMTTETRGQNSWVNYGPHGEKNRKASASDTVYADQKVGLLPEWTMRDRGSPEPIIAYHGGPHDFNQFDVSKIGGGEGNQAYGHGLYFAEKSDVSEWYRHQLAGRRDPLLKKYGLDSEDGAMVGLAVADARGDAAKVAKEFRQYANDLRAEGRTDMATRNMIKRAENKAQYLEDAGREKGHMYQVAIDAHPEQFLDWDKPLSKQSPAVQKALSDLDPETYRPGSPDYDPKERGELIYHRLMNYNRSEQDSASKRLRDRGVPGIRYLDQDSRSRGKGSSNYVTFDAPRLLRKYALPGAVGFGSLAFKKED